MGLHSCIIHVAKHVSAMSTKFNVIRYTIIDV